MKQKTRASRYSARDQPKTAWLPSLRLLNKAYCHRTAYRFQKGSKLWKSGIHQKKILKLAGGRVHTPHPTPLDQPLAISYRNYQKGLAYFSHLAPLVVLFY